MITWLQHSNGSFLQCLRNDQQIHQIFIVATILPVRPPFGDHRNLYNIIDSSPFGNVKWQKIMVAYDGERLTDDIKPWMDDKYEVWFHDPCKVMHNMLVNPTYASEINYHSYREYSTKGDKRQWKDFMSGDWVWDPADEIVKDPSTLGSTFVPVILGSDKTMVSVRTGNNEYYPLYASIGNIHNMAVIGFVKVVLKGRPLFQKFRQQLFHSSLSKILNSLKPGMTTPKVTQFGDGHYWWVIYELGPYIVDYEEQVLLACIIQNWCPKCVANHDNLQEGTLCHLHDHTEALIEEALNLDSDLWDDFGIVEQLVPFTNDFPQADIYQMISLTSSISLIAAVASFSGLRRFPQGRSFKQWTGDDSKALMNAYLPTIEGHVPTDVVRTFRALLDFAYLVHCDIITEDSLLKIKDALAHFHHYHEIFRMTGIISTFSRPRQYSLVHYVRNIQLFVALNGLCSSITENKHIKAVKEPWRRLSRYKVLGQILLTNQQLDKLSAARVDFTCRGILTGTCLSAAMNALGRAKKCAQTVPALADELDIPCLPNLLGWFLFQQLHPDDPHDPSDVPLADCPLYLNKISVFNSASSCFYVPSDLSSIGGMRVEYIWSCPSWRNEHSRHDCVFVNTDSSLPGMQGLEVACIHTFFSFQYRGEVNTADEDTGMWLVCPGYSANNSPEHAIIHINTIYHAAHLIPVCGTEFLPRELKFYHSYDTFQAYYINK
ncbi:uncharacterized protein EDB91DRAFT_1239580 [Suillus paluster]|uniref:uncharacterized protein n=1 Tax=Suillus paluster TaxID=48578 RepID=UPI001B864716|nr:uncharacterized protein EDB91DRAFT_1239580 [Suillus paluster]KAG1727079.1 hypothetical protein EDB91DRAFT_1239580 [Suillus paluster]